MGRPRKYLRLDEILDLVLPLIPTRTKLEVPSFNQWASKLRAEIKANPRVQMKESRWRKWSDDRSFISEEE